MSPSTLVSELGHSLEESQNQRDARIEQLWTRLDPGRTGELDFKSLQNGFRRIDHRTAHTRGESWLSECFREADSCLIL